MSFDRLLARADQTVEGPDLNRVLYETKQEVGPAATGYEVVVDDRSFEEFLRVNLPLLTEHLLAKRMPMLGGPTLLVTIWRNDRAHIFGGDHFFEALLEVLDLTEEALRAKIRQARAALGLEPDPWGGTSPPQLLLPGPGSS